jgi:hypothetical protein
VTRKQRLGLLLLTAAVLVAAFVVLRPGGDDDRTATTSPAPAPANGTPPAQPALPAPQPDPGPLLTGEKVRKIAAKKGDVVRFRVRSASADEVHIHGYDIKRDLPAGKTVRIRFKASIEGIFVIEFEKAGKQIASLRVEP